MSTMGWCTEIVIFSVINYLTLDVRADHRRKAGGSTDWDELIFTQMWGYSECLKFKHTKPSGVCRFQNRPSIWSIHGIWPTKKGTHGPDNCRKVDFDIDLLEPIVDELDEYWYTIDNNEDSVHFWEHEWLKHGSCAMSDEEVSNESKYFAKGIQLRNQYDLFKILKDRGVIPLLREEGYSLSQLLKTLNRGLAAVSGSEVDANPIINCIRMEKNVENAKEGQYHLYSIELCLDKQFRIIDCQARNHTSDFTAYFKHSHLQTNCPTHSNIFYDDFRIRKSPGDEKERGEL